MNRCSWCNLKNSRYIEYHDKEWGVPNFLDKYLLEMLILEMFQAGLSFECILNKRENFYNAYDEYDLDKICSYGDEKYKELNRKLTENEWKQIEDYIDFLGFENGFVQELGEHEEEYVPKWW